VTTEELAEDRLDVLGQQVARGDYHVTRLCAPCSSHPSSVAVNQRPLYTAPGADAPAPAALQTLAARRDFLWHQRFELGAGVFASGSNDVDWLLHTAGVPDDLSGASVLDIGTTNGGAAFTLERRGASRVLATDIVDPMHLGFQAIHDVLGSSVEFRQLSVYELSRIVDEQFDLVIFWGVLYLLRHPLLALDNVRAATAGTAYVETAVADAELAPSADPDSVNAWPSQAPTRAMVRTSAVAGPPEYQQLSYERPLLSTVAGLGLDGRLHALADS
jgi:2-polyprenyl-3-methyl-5-hydroxy-6-metoxy-1,4-benzoquinol methylase